MATQATGSKYYRIKYHIALDLDDTILDFVNHVCSVLRMEYGVDLTPEDDIIEWNLNKVLDKIVGENWWNWWKERDWLWALAPAVPGAIGSIRTLHRSGHYLEIVTSKPEWARAQTWRWIGKWRPEVDRITIVPFEVNARVGKHEVSQATLLVDDKPSTCYDWIADAPWRRAILFDRPHNAKAPMGDIRQMLRANGWQEVIACIHKLESGGW